MQGQGVNVICSDAPKVKVVRVHCDAKKTKHQLKSPRTSKEVMVIQIAGVLGSIPGT
jgi:hypothetical protein